MPLPGLRRLLDRLDETYHAERVRTMAVLGRDHAGDPALAVLAAHSGWAPAFLDVLPHALRHAEARLAGSWACVRSGS